MITSKTYSYIGITALLCFAVIFFARQNRHEGKVFVHAEAVRSPYGWGYNIYAGKRLYIKQEFIPAVSGYHGFKSEQDAQNTGNLVVHRITSNQQPAITLSDLDSLGISYK